MLATVLDPNHALTVFSLPVNLPRLCFLTEELPLFAGSISLARETHPMRAGKRGNHVTTEIGEPRTDAPLCHTAMDESTGRPKNKLTPAASSNDVISFTWPPSKRLLVIAGCSLAVAAALAAIFVFDVSPGNLAVAAMILVCPLMHIFMMRGKGHGGQQGCHGSQHNDVQTAGRSKGDKA